LHLKPQEHLGLLATVFAVVCLFGGLGLVGVALAAQRSAPTPVGEPSPGVIGSEQTSPSTAVPPMARAPQMRPARPITLARSKPVSLDIPAIAVHSSLLHLGQQADGSLETPQPGPDYDRAAWYRYSPPPGSLGPAILLGHVDSAANGPSVFYRLGELRAGDRISVTRADGTVARFVVDEVKRFPKDAFPTELVYGDLDHAGLRLLTCGGEFDDVSGHYLDNIVVFATLDQ
jgi:hypothetical protein